MKIVSVEIVCSKDDVKFIQNELLNLQLGIYSLGTRVRELTKEEEREVLLMVPKDVLEDYLKEDIDETHT